MGLLAYQSKHRIQYSIRNRNRDKKEFRGVFHEQAIIYLNRNGVLDNAPFVCSSMQKNVKPQKPVLTGHCKG